MAKNHPRLVKVEALEAFTITRPFGQFHGDPDSKNNRICMVPEDELADLRERGKVKLVEGDLSQLDHDGDGNPGGGTSGGSGEEISDVRAEYERVVGKRPYMGWDIGELRAKIAAHQAEADTPDEGADDGAEDDGDDAAPSD